MTLTVALMLVAFLHWINFRNEMVSSASRMVIARGRVGEGAHFLGRCLGVQTWHTNAQIMDIMGFYGSDPGSRPRSILVFSCLVESPAAMLGDLRAFLTETCCVCPSRWGGPPQPLLCSPGGLLLLAPPPTLCQEGNVGGGEQGPWPGPTLTQWQFLPFLLGFPACFPCLPGFGPARRKELVPRVHTPLLLGAFCLGCLSVRVWRSLSTADLPVLPGRFPQRLTQWAHVGISPARPPPAPSFHTLPGRCPSAPRSLLTRLPHSAQPHPLGNRPSCPHLWSSLRASCRGTVVTGSEAVSLHLHRSVPPDGRFRLVL